MPSACFFSSKVDKIETKSDRFDIGFTLLTFYPIKLVVSLSNEKAKIMSTT